MAKIGRKFTIFFMLLLCISVIFTGCGGGGGSSSKVYYTLTITIEGHGSVNPPSGSKFLKGTVVSLSATPDEGYRFLGWEGPNKDEVKDNKIIMDGNKQLIAPFGFDPQYVKVEGTVKGTDGRYLKGAVVRIDSQEATTGDNGMFLLPPVRRGLNKTLTVTKHGYVGYTGTFDLTGDPTDDVINIGNITLEQDIPEYDDIVTGQNVFFPSFDSQGNSAFRVSAGSTDSLSLMMFFPTAGSSESSYGFTVNFSPGLFNSIDALGEFGRISDRSEMYGNVLGLRDEKDTFSEPGRIHLNLREKERELIKYRSEILELQGKRGIQVLDDIGGKRLFYKMNFISQRFEQISAVCHAIGDHVIVYVDEAATSGISSNYIRQIFDQRIYSTLNDYFGNELDVDSNGRIIILLTPLDIPEGVLYGYFYAADQLPKSSENPYSNEAEIIYVNSNIPSKEEKLILGTIAHEFQHLIHFSERLRNCSQYYGNFLHDTWLNEGFSVLAMDLAGYGYVQEVELLDRYVKRWLEEYYIWSLTDFSGHNADYGGSYLFARYLYDNYGKNATLGINRSPYGGMKAVCDVTGGSFKEIYRSFVCAVIFNMFDVEPPDPRLSFAESFHIRDWESYFLFYAIPANQSGTIRSSQPYLRPWGFETFFIYGKSPLNGLDISISSDPAGEFEGIIVKVR